MMLDGAALAQFLLTGLTTGCAYALVALAIVLMFNVSGVVNLAQGEYGALGGLLLASMSAMHLPLPMSLGRCCHPRRRLPDLGQGSAQRSRLQR
jgi:branched-subunit amino acid ABC-type transport system permease component